VFHILHIPSGQLIFCANNHNTFYVEPRVAIFKTKAAAGKAIECYLVGSKPNKRGLALTQRVYVMPDDYTIINSINFSYLKFTDKYTLTSPRHLLNLAEQKLPVAIRLKLMRKKNPNMYHKHEFLITEAI
jgi:hypothetical protein